MQLPMGSQRNRTEQASSRLHFRANGGKRANRELVQSTRGPFSSRSGGLCHTRWVEFDSGSIELGSADGGYAPVDGSND